MGDLGLVVFALLGLNARPFDGETVGVEAGSLQQRDVLGITVVVVAGVPGGLVEGGVLHPLHGPVVGMNVVALHLVGGGGRAD